MHALGKVFFSGEANLILVFGFGIALGSSALWYLHAAVLKATWIQHLDHHRLMQAIYCTRMDGSASIILQFGKFSELKSSHLLRNLANRKLSRSYLFLTLVLHYFLTGKRET